MKKESDRKRLDKIEFILAIIIAVVLIGTLFSQEVLRFPPTFISVLLILFVGIKIATIIRKKGTIFEDYVSLVIIMAFWIIYLTIKNNLNVAVLVVITLTLLYSVGLIPSIKNISRSRNTISFIVSYMGFIVAVIVLFAGAYFANSTSFVQQGYPVQLSFEDSLYFSTMTFTTVGYGDIAPTGINKLVSSVEAITAIALNIAFIGYILASKRFNPVESKPKEKPVFLLTKK